VSGEQDCQKIGDDQGMNRYLKGFMGILISLFLSGCAHTSSTAGFPINVYYKVLVLLHIESEPPEKGEVAVGVCLLDPASNIPHNAAAATVDPAKAPAVQIAETSHDFGLISEDGDFVHRFKIKNVGNAVLKIKKVAPG
jgi:hypothetical protein